MLYPKSFALFLASVPVPFKLKLDEVDEDRVVIGEGVSLFYTPDKNLGLRTVLVVVYFI